ncbi:hypothetical protein [Hespellia stercorisuis]|uniref:PD-(D/E)XK nuclease family transposase n=1 Tax=Hespellia stercorisuis DSM 15480 TaxID=1121950 RepID=A0A1M6XB76_9FIRM|nr:hypothetical protein [Hespellia stercorisuis]SHL03204.1 hypothetical protein SAMN02745243_04185 [Hespellia stercorisuis DSM 15480]
MCNRENRQVIRSSYFEDAVLVNPGETNRPEKILGDRTEDSVPYEGEITYDIRFHLWIPGKKKQFLKLLLNIEIQKEFYKTYDLITRGLFYGCRMISAQKDTEFTDSNYQDIKKVYSIWICLDAPNYIGNAVTRYGIHKEDLIGKTPDKTLVYDKIIILMIYLNRRKDKKENSIFHFLNTLFTPDIGVKEKEKILKEDMGINIGRSKKVRKELKQMCNLGEALVWETEQRVTKKVTKEVTKEVTEKITENMTDQGVRGIIKVCQNLGGSREDAKKCIEDNFHLSEEAADGYLKKYWK